MILDANISFFLPVPNGRNTTAECKCRWLIIVGYIWIFPIFQIYFYFIFILFLVPLFTPVFRASEPNMEPNDAPLALRGPLQWSSEVCGFENISLIPMLFPSFRSLGTYNVTFGVSNTTARLSSIIHLTIYLFLPYRYASGFSLVTHLSPLYPALIQ